MNTKNCKEELIEITISLINENKGEVEKVTIRDIAKKSGVSIGLINYHFGNKDNLITECVQKIISNVVTNFKPNMEIGKELPKFEAGKARLINAAQLVFGFFYSYPSISRISILNDYNHYTQKSNSFSSLQGFSRIIGNAIEDPLEKERIAFTLTCSMQVMFLKSFDDSVFLGYDFSKQPDRDKYISDLVNRIMNDTPHLHGSRGE